MAVGKINGVFLTHIFGPCDLGLKTFSSTFIEYLLSVSETIISPLRQITGQILKSEKKKDFKIRVDSSAYPSC